ncbi:hypothetical protein KGP36_03035 [Patescibacteria group bacterium]|nr:hypothetical protein [Patescibacteria group bacterium]
MADRFRKISTDYATINRYVHDTAMMIVQHAYNTKDCSTAQGLINCMPQSARKLALITWFTKYSPIVVKDSDKWQSKMHKPDSKMYVEWQLEEAAANPWYTIAEEMGKESKKYSLDEILAMLPKLAKTVHKKAEGMDGDEAAQTEAFAQWLDQLKIPSFASVKAAVSNDADTPAEGEVEGNIIELPDPEARAA